MNDDRKDLILSLAGAMGMSGKTTREGTCFDPSTGTFFCGSHVYQPADIVAAKQFLKKHMQRLSSYNDASYAFYEIAFSAIELMEKQGNLVSNGGRLVVKDGMSA